MCLYGILKKKIIIKNCQIGLYCKLLDYLQREQIVMHKFRTEHLDRHILSTYLYQTSKELR